MKLAEELFFFFSSLLRKQATGCSCDTQSRIIFSVPVLCDMKKKTLICKLKLNIPATLSAYSYEF